MELTFLASGKKRPNVLYPAELFSSVFADGDSTAKYVGASGDMTAGEQRLLALAVGEFVEQQGDNDGSDNWTRVKPPSPSNVVEPVSALCAQVCSHFLRKPSDAKIIAEAKRATPAEDAKLPQQKSGNGRHSVLQSGRAHAKRWFRRSIVDLLLLEFGPWGLRPKLSQAAASTSTDSEELFWSGKGRSPKKRRGETPKQRFKRLQTNALTEMTSFVCWVLSTSSQGVHLSALAQPGSLLGVVTPRRVEIYLCQKRSWGYALRTVKGAAHALGKGLELLSGVLKTVHARTNLPRFYAWLGTANAPVSFDESRYAEDINNDSTPTAVRKLNKLFSPTRHEQRASRVYAKDCDVLTLQQLLQSRSKICSHAELLCKEFCQLEDCVDADEDELASSFERVTRAVVALVQVLVQGQRPQLMPQLTRQCLTFHEEKAKGGGKQITKVVIDPSK